VRCLPFSVILDTPILTQAAENSQTFNKSDYFVIINVNFSTELINFIAFLKLIYQKIVSMTVAITPDIVF